MLNPQLRAYFVRLLIAAILIGQPLSPRTLGAQKSDPALHDLAIPVLPTRRPTTTPPSAPPALLPGAERVTPMTLDTVIRRSAAVNGRSAAIRQTITRTADRVHFAPVQGREWLFERNVRDARRVSASLIEHPSRQIVLYGESDLRNMLGIRGWSQVLALGFDPEWLAALEPSGPSRKVGGLYFARYAATDKGGPAEEVWWSSEHLFPSGFVTADSTGSTLFSVERVQTGADAAMLRAPVVRFPTYKVVDLAEWLEQH